MPINPIIPGNFLAQQSQDQFSLGDLTKLLMGLLQPQQQAQPGLLQRLSLGAPARPGPGAPQQGNISSMGDLMRNPGSANSQGPAGAPANGAIYDPPPGNSTDNQQLNVALQQYGVPISGRLPEGILPPSKQVLTQDGTWVDRDKVSRERPNSSGFYDASGIRRNSWPTPQGNVQSTFKPTPEDDD